CMKITAKTMNSTRHTSARNTSPAILAPLVARGLPDTRPAAGRAEPAEIGAPGPATTATGAAAGCQFGENFPAGCQSVQPSRPTSESLLTRPSSSHLRITSPLAGPYCPPLGGRTYQIAAGASAIGSAEAAAAAGGGAEADDGPAAGVGGDPAATAVAEAAA